MQKTTWTTDNTIERKWHLVDVKDQILGRAATRIASLLIGKGKVEATSNGDFGDYVVVINSAKANLSRGKEVKKMYQSHTSHPGGFKEIRYDKLMIKDPTAPLRMAVEKMLPSNKLRDARMLRLFVYADANHKQEAQQPVPYKLEK
jgi:large subunit ribosomal protein L13